MKSTHVWENFPAKTKDPAPGDSLDGTVRPSDTPRTPPDPRHAIFGKLMWGMIQKMGGDFCGDEWSEEVLPLAQKAGLCGRVIYDPDKHGYIEDGEPGHEIWWLGEPYSSNVPDEVSLPASGTKACSAGDVPEVPQAQGLAPSVCSHLSSIGNVCSKADYTPESTPPQDLPGWPPAEPPEHGRGWPPSVQPHPIDHVMEGDSGSSHTAQYNTVPTGSQQPL
jgi:hypothetical protein